MLLRPDFDVGIKPFSATRRPFREARGGSAKVAVVARWTLM